jgi:hypothetical protein
MKNRGDTHEKRSSSAMGSRLPEYLSVDVLINTVETIDE